jgi:hypothetical protein
MYSWVSILLKEAALYRKNKNINLTIFMQSMLQLQVDTLSQMT